MRDAVLTLLLRPVLAAGLGLSAGPLLAATAPALPAAAAAAPQAQDAAALRPAGAVAPAAPRPATVLAGSAAEPARTAPARAPVLVQAAGSLLLVAEGGVVGARIAPVASPAPGFVYEP